MTPISSFCKIIKGFGSKIVAFDIVENKNLTELGVKYLPLEELFATADIISLHCPLNEHTKHLINKDSISKMKNGVMIINTSRGALIKTADVIEGLIERKIGYLGIDVYEQEENIFFEDLSEHIIDDEHIRRLMSFPNVLITSHQAFFTKEAMDEIITTTLNNVKSYAEGDVLHNEVV
jgi:D-lactate dehydrogenase